MVPRTVALLALLAAAPAAAATAYLAELLGAMTSYRAEFTQTITSRFGDVLQETTGRIHLSRPNRLRWEVDEPFPQLVLADGQSVWDYDPDLAQASVQPLGDVIEGAPAVLLAGADTDLAAHFDVAAAAPPAVGGVRFVLTPRADDSVYRELVLTFSAGGVLTGLAIADHLDQHTEIAFANAERNVALEAALFAFGVPAGVELIGNLPDSVAPR